MGEQKEKIEYQFVMNYKAYRRKMISLRAGITVIVAGGLCGLCALNVVLGIVLAVAVLCIGSIFVLTALGNEQTYTVYNTRIVLKRKGRDKRVSVPMENVTAVSSRRAFYERSLATDTVTLIATDEKGRKKKYRLRHVFGSKPAVAYINGRIDERKARGENNESGKQDV